MAILFVAIATLDLKKKDFFNDYSTKTTEAVGQMLNG